MSSHLTEHLKNIHYKIREYLDVKDYTNLTAYLESFDYDGVDINELKTILILIWPQFIQSTPVYPVRTRLQERFDAYMNQYTKKN
jgi:hypothetical protein